MDKPLAWANESAMDEPAAPEQAPTGKPSGTPHITSLTVPSLSDRPAVLTDCTHINSNLTSSGTHWRSALTLWLSPSKSAQSLCILSDVWRAQASHVFYLSYRAWTPLSKDYTVHTTTTKYLPYVTAAVQNLCILVAKVSRSTFACPVASVNNAHSAFNLSPFAGDVQSASESSPTAALTISPILSLQ